MPMTIVIGSGISAAAYLASVEQELGRVDVLGGEDLWRQVDGDHQMGQPRPLLTGNLLGWGPGNRNFAERPIPGSRFMLARDFAGLVAHHLAEHAHVRLPDSWVERIEQGQHYAYRVSLNQYGGRFYVECDNVILANGPGPNRTLTAGEDAQVEVDIQAMDGYVVAGSDFMSPHWRMPHAESCVGKTIAVYGGSATAAWVVELALMRGMTVVKWFTRPGRGGDAWNADTRFETAFPPGARNVRVQIDCHGVREVLNLTGVDLGRPHNDVPFVKLKFRNSQGREVRLAVDLLVYALGSQHGADTGIRALLSQGLQGQLVAYYDRDFAISAQPSLLAVGTPDRSLMIVGAAMSSAAGFRGNDLTLQGDPTRNLTNIAPYAEISATLPPAARPTEGIAMVMAGIEALNQYMPARPAAQTRVGTYRTPARTTARATSPQQAPQGSVNRQGGRMNFHELDYEWDINFNTANRTQLAAFLAQQTDLEPFAANLAVALIIHLRTRAQNVLGLSEPQVSVIVDTAQAFAREQRRVNPNWEATRFLRDVALGADRNLEVCVDYLTTNQAYVGFWGHHRISCT